MSLKFTVAMSKYVVRNRYRFRPVVERGAKHEIIACHSPGRCSAPGSYCIELAACELLDARCAALCADGCDGACSKCEAAVVP